MLCSRVLVKGLQLLFVCCFFLLSSIWIVDLLLFFAWFLLWFWFDLICLVVVFLILRLNSIFFGLIFNFCSYKCPMKLVSYLEMCEIRFVCYFSFKCLFACFVPLFVLCACAFTVKIHSNESALTEKLVFILVTGFG